MRVLAGRDFFLAAIAGLTGGLDSLFVKEILHANAVVLGFLASIWSATFIVFILIGGWLSDQYDRKRMLLAGMALTLPNPLIFAFASNWDITIVAQFLGATGTAFAAPAYVSMLFSSSVKESRTRSLAVMNTLNSLANTIVPPAAAIVVEKLGGYGALRYMFVAQFFLSAGILVYTWKKLEGDPIDRRNPFGSLGRQLKEIISQINRIYRVSREKKATSWLFLALTGPWAWEAVGPFWVIYAAETCGSSILVLGLLPAVYSITAAILLFPLAEVSDNKGRKTVILLARPFLYLCLVLLLLGGTFSQYAWIPLIPLLAWIFRAIGDSSAPSWTALSVEVIPEELQSEWEATRDFLWRIMTIPAAIAGGLLWEVDPRLPFAMAFSVDCFIRFPILIYKIPETLKKE